MLSSLQSTGRFSTHSAIPKDGAKFEQLAGSLRQRGFNVETWSTDQLSTPAEHYQVRLDVSLQLGDKTNSEAGRLSQKWENSWLRAIEGTIKKEGSFNYSEFLGRDGLTIEQADHLAAALQGRGYITQTNHVDGELTVVKLSAQKAMQAPITQGQYAQKLTDSTPSQQVSLSLSQTYPRRNVQLSSHQSSLLGVTLASGKNAFSSMKRALGLGR